MLWEEDKKSTLKIVNIILITQWKILNDEIKNEFAVIGGVICSMQSVWSRVLIGHNEE